MQIISIYLKPGEGDAGVNLLKKLEVTDYNLLKSSSCDLIVVKRPLEKTDKILDTFQEEFKFIHEENRSIVIQPVGVILPREEEIEKKTEELSSRESIIQFAEESSEPNKRYLALFFFSAVVATLGLLADNIAVVVGAMIIAPAFGPLASSSIGVTLGRMDLFKKGLKTETMGVFVAILTAAFLALLIPGIELTESLKLRMYPTILELLVALAAGGAGAYTLISGKGSSIVGVMVAAALLPTMCAIGIGLTIFNPILVSGAFLLLMVNIVSIILAMVLIFWIIGPHQDHLHMGYEYWLAEMNIHKVIRYLVVIVIIMTLPLLWLTYEDMVTKIPEIEITKIFSSPEISGNFELIGVETERDLIKVSLYAFDGVDDQQINLLQQMIRRNIDSRYTLELEVIEARKLTYP